MLDGRRRPMHVCVIDMKAVIITGPSINLAAAATI